MTSTEGEVVIALHQPHVLDRWVLICQVMPCVCVCVFAYVRERMCYQALVFTYPVDDLDHDAGVKTVTIMETQHKRSYLPYEERRNQ